MQDNQALLMMQRDFVGALREPIFGESRRRSDLPPREGQVSASFVRSAQRYLQSSKLISAQARLEIYHRQYWYRLLDSIAEDFPALRQMLGEDLFWQVIETYLHDQAPSHFSLAQLGKGLADFIAHRDLGLASPVHAVELATLEYALMHAHEAAQLAPIDPQQLAQAPLQLQAHLQCFALRSTVDTTLRRYLRGQKPGAMRAAAPKAQRYVVVYRRDREIFVQRISKAAFLLLTAIDQHQGLDAAMQALSKQYAGMKPPRPAQISQLFSTWIQHGWICAVATENPQASTFLTGAR